MSSGALLYSPLSTVLLDANLKDRQKFHEEAFGEGSDEKVVLFPKNRIV
jgi:hypothetical protein